MYIRLIAFLFISFSLFGQEQSSYREIDSLSYAAYLKNDYEAVKSINKLAAENDISFYYLHLRSGLVAFQNEKYESALKQFKVAYEMNPNDSLSTFYLYYSFLNSGREEQALEFLEKQNETVKEKLADYKLSKKSISLSLLSLKTKNIENQQAASMIASESIAGESLLNGDVMGGSLGFSFLLNNRLRLNFQGTYYRTESVSFEEFNLPQYRKTTAFKNNQYQFNVAANYALKYDFNLGLGYGYFLTNSSFAISSFNPGPNNWYTSVEQSQTNGSLKNVSLAKRFGRFNTGIAYTRINLYGDENNQLQFSTFVYPFQNNKLYTLTSITRINNGIVFAQNIAKSITKKTWLDLGFKNGNMFNYVASNGLLVYNSADPVYQELSAGLSVYLKKIDVSFYYTNQLKRGTYYQFNSLTEFYGETFDYRNNNFLITLKWKL